MPIILPFIFNEFHPRSFGASAILEIFAQSITGDSCRRHRARTGNVGARIDMNSEVCLPIINMTGRTNINFGIQCAEEIVSLPIAMFTRWSEARREVIFRMFSRISVAATVELSIVGV